MDGENRCPLLPGTENTRVPRWPLAFFFEAGHLLSTRRNSKTAKLAIRKAGDQEKTVRPWFTGYRGA